MVTWMDDGLILNALVVNAGEIKMLDLAIRAGRIEQIGADLRHRPAKFVLDLEGKTVLPGFIDDQVHFRQPGLTHKGDVYSESCAAVAGGITSFMDMPNTKPATLSRHALAEKYRAAAKNSVANYAFYLGASNDNLAEIEALEINEACGVKIFMGASTGNMLVDDVKILAQIFASSPLLIATHCEDTPMILAAEAQYRSQYGEDIDMAQHANIRSEAACYRSSSLAVELAERHGTRLHVLHLSTGKELSLFSAKSHKDKRITAEVCVHHLFFNEQNYAQLGSLIKCNPAIKTVHDQRALIAAVNANKIDVIATDHAPHTLKEKKNTYFQAPSGVPLVQHALLSLLEHFHNHDFTLELIANKTSHAVADVFRIKDRGYIREGYWADLVVIDLLRTYQVRNDNILYKCGWSPFTDYSFRSSIHATLVSGQIAYQNGVVNTGVRGNRLEFY